MSKTVYYWWYAYGRFAPGENNLPHFGQVMRHYREIRGWSKEELATVLQCTVRYVEMLESSKNNNMPVWGFLFFYAVSQSCDVHNDIDISWLLVAYQAAQPSHTLQANLAHGKASVTPGIRF